MEPYIHRVQYYETDKMSITHHSNYIRWMEEARIDFLARSGWSFDKLESLGIVSPTTAVACKYKAPTTFPEEITIHVSLESFNGVTIKINYTMVNSAGKTVCEASSEHCFLNRDGGLLRLKRDYPDFYQFLMDACQK